MFTLSRITNFCMHAYHPLFFFLPTLLSIREAPRKTHTLPTLDPEKRTFHPLYSGSWEGNPFFPFFSYDLDPSGILAPTFYIFFASALPVIAFGEQLNRDTGGSLSTVETLASTAICGIIHSIFGGQPLLILGVAEPTVIMYTILYQFCSKTPDLGPKMFLPWAGWVCMWTSFLLIMLAIFNACTVISRFTRVAEELFGMLITVLFFQEAIKNVNFALQDPTKNSFDPQGILGEFGTPKDENPSLEEYQFQWRYTNGLLAVIFSFGIILTAMMSRRARAWRYGSGK
ncbi:unnamed protein product [Sphenostylis stenocarpa]|uniref:Bicarbonate transporter-like transmembrane domain-containing protein n=1 Tax=Sphenostylis stenocarpa TaxID=92480 RepID=A0AA86T0W5_9FABA|nr:unnamed protein product [Sphenostylis stenocarpa]